MTGRLTRDQVIAKYAPVRHPQWTPEVEAQFFAGLPAPSYRHTIKLNAEKAMLVREFATETLKAKRQSAGYISTLGAVLGEFAKADANGTEYVLTRRGGHGTEKTVRTIQVQMLDAGMVVRDIRSHGYGFVGAVFVYSPIPPHRHRIGTEKYLEECHRKHEGQSAGHRHPIPANLSPADVPF